MHWVWMKSTPAATFLPRRMARNSSGSPKGFSAPPMKMRGSTTGEFLELRISSPQMNFFSSRMVFSAPISWMESRSYTFLQPAWLPKLWWSPLRHRMLRSPRA
jgi:hypothetical protein